MNEKDMAVIGLISMLIVMCMIVPAAAQPTPYMTHGYIWNENGNPCNNPVVTVINLNTSTEWSAETNAGYNYYQLVLKNSSEVKGGDTLRIIACEELGNNESNCNVSDHDVTADEINAGGVFNVNLTLNHYCLNYEPGYPYCTWEQANWSGPAVMQMMIDHYRPEEPSQSDLNATGIAHNQGCNADLSYVDPKGMGWTLNDILHNTSSYGGGKYANYGIGSYTTVESALWYICYWHYLGPGAEPTYGDYSNWMSIRGIHTSENPKWKSQGSYDIYGFWINDPNPTGGIGENTYKSVNQWTGTYFKNLTGVRDGDSYKNRYVAVCEPPEQDPADVRLVHSKARFSGTITAEATDEELTVDVSGVPLNQMVCNRKLAREKENKVVQAAIDGVNEELAPFDRNFKKTFDGTVAGKPMPVKSDAGDYYLVPFGIESDGKSVLSVVIVDSDGGKFKEASWVKEPVKYLPVTAQEALKTVYKEMKGKSMVKVLKRDKATGKLKKADIVNENVEPLGDITYDETEKQRRKAYLELVYKGESPYYPVWKVTIGDSVFFVDQSGTLTTG
ncbi:MAG: hypothetical protein KAU16_00470 [Methanophagales archaeon]|nr:hypothetical protein [Methanophagales archaeon]